MTHYEVVYGQQLPCMVSYLPSTSKVNVVDNLLQNQKAILVMLNENLVMTQNHMKQQANKHCLERSLEEGDQVFLHLQTYKQTSLNTKNHHKFHVHTTFLEVDEEGSLWLQPKVVFDAKSCNYVSTLSMKF